MQKINMYLIIIMNTDSSKAFKIAKSLHIEVLNGFRFQSQKINITVI